MYTVIKHFYWVEGDGYLVDEQEWEREFYTSPKKAFNKALEKERESWRYKECVKGERILIPSIKKKGNSIYLRIFHVPEDFLDRYKCYGLTLKDLRELLKSEWGRGKCLTEYEIVNVDNLPIV